MSATTPHSTEIIATFSPRIKAGVVLLPVLIGDGRRAQLRLSRNLAEKFSRDLGNALAEQDATEADANARRSAKLLRRPLLKPTGEIL